MKYTITLSGNPNVGKSTVFNALTGLKQHTGNWTGKTVSSAVGKYRYKNDEYKLIDLPGTYSLISHSKEEEVARDIIIFNDNDVNVVVCDAMCLERNLNLVLQILEITENVVVVVNLLDEAKKNNVDIDLKKLSHILNVDVVGTSARSGKGIELIQESVKKCINKKRKSYKVKYDILEDIICEIESELKKYDLKNLNSRWLSLRLIENEESLINSINEYLGFNLIDERVNDLIIKSHHILLENDITKREIKDYFITNIFKVSEKITNTVVRINNKNYHEKNVRIDRILTSKVTGIPIMMLLLGVVFWITLVGASYPSQVLFDLLFWLGDKLKWLFNFLHVNKIIIDIFIDGVYKVLAWVVAVMLPPMAIFFPLFTLLEDLGYLPRIAFNLDKYFKKCNACGKQGLTMCMGFGCNALGVTGARIIDSKRERLIAILTNSFMPCNGRFPILISIITMFSIVSNSFFKVLMLVIMILLGIFMTYIVSYILSRTLLKGEPSSFVLELPPYRKLQVLKVIVRSIFDKTIKILLRAVVVAAPAGLVIWFLSTISIDGSSLLKIVSDFLDPFGRSIGLDGVILLSFLLGFPANEIVIPIMIMCYMKTGHLMDISDLGVLKEILVNNGWTLNTAICVLIFTIFHFPCSTTCLTIRKETGSYKWMIFSFLMPTLIGICLCFLTTCIFKII